MAHIMGIFPVFTFCFAMVVADILLPLPVPLAFRPKKMEDRPAVICNSTDPPRCADKRFGFCVSDDAYPIGHITVVIENSQLVNEFSYKTVSNEESVYDPVKINKKGRCLSTNVLVKPIRMANVQGNWRVVVQDAKDIIQRERVVLCTKVNDVCRMPGNVPLQCHSSRCSQKFVVRQLLAYDPCDQNRGVFVDSFKIPSACSCRYSRSIC